MLWCCLVLFSGSSLLRHWNTIHELTRINTKRLRETQRRKDAETQSFKNHYRD